MSKKILVIDDEELLIKSFVKLLGREGYDVFVAKRGDDALEMTEEDSYDLIICDIRMPGMNGIKTVARIREVCQRRGITRPPEIFVTGYANEEDEKKARQLNPSGYFLKPFNINELLSMVRRLLIPESKSVR